MISLLKISCKCIFYLEDFFPFALQLFNPHRIFPIFNRRRSTKNARHGFSPRKSSNNGWNIRLWSWILKGRIKWLGIWGSSWILRLIIQIKMAWIEPYHDFILLQLPHPFSSYGERPSKWDFYSNLNDSEARPVSWPSNYLLLLMIQTFYKNK